MFNYFAVKKKKTPGVVFTSVEGDDVEPQFNALIANYTENALMGEFEVRDLDLLHFMG